MLEIIDYSPKHFSFLASCMNGLQDYLVSVDTSSLLTRGKDYGEQYAKELLASIESHEGKIFLAQYHGQLIGCVAGIIESADTMEALGYTTEMHIGRVIELYVDPNFRGKHIGRALMQKITEYFIEKHCNFSRVEVFAPNSHAHEFYRACGYENESIDLLKTL